jgi:HSP20 family protein
MTIMRLYNRNGNDTANSPVYRFSDVMRDVFGNEAPVFAHTQVRANVKEENEAYYISLAVPGLKKSDIQLNLDSDILTVSHRSDEAEVSQVFSRREFDYSNFEKTFRLPESVKTDAITAKYEDGILNVTLPKKDEAINKGPIEIKIS